MLDTRTANYKSIPLIQLAMLIFWSYRSTIAKDKPIRRSQTGQFH